MSASLDSFAPNTVERHAPGDDDVVFDIKFCGICHTVRHVARSLQPPSVFCSVFFLPEHSSQFSFSTYFTRSQEEHSGLVAMNGSSSDAVDGVKIPYRRG